MTVDVRAKVFCNLGTIISGNLADEALSAGQGLISCRGQLVLAGLSTPAVGSVVNIGWQRGSTIARLPRTLRVLSSFANPFTRQTTVQLGDKLVFLANLKGKKAEEEQPAEDESNGPEPNDYPSSDYDWQPLERCYLPKAGAKPYNFSDPKAASQLTVREDNALNPAKVMNRAPMGIYASSVLQKCCFALGIASTGSALTNVYQDDFDLSAGYVSVLDQLISSESLFGYLNESETLVLRGWDGTGTGPLLDENNIIELSGINSGVLPGQEVTVSFDSKRLDPTAADQAQDELDQEEAAEEVLDDPTSTEEEKEAAQNELDALVEEKQLRDWERDEAVTYNQKYDFFVQDDEGAIVYTLSVAHNPRSVTLSYYDESDYKTKAISTEERIFAGELGSILQAKIENLVNNPTQTSPEELRLIPQFARQELLFRTEEYLEYEPIKQEEAADSLALDPDLLCADPDGVERVADEDADQDKRVEKQQVRQTVTRFEPIEALIGKLNISGIDWGEFDLGTLPSGEYEAERTVITYVTNQPEGQTKTRTDRYLAYGLTQNGQQDTAEKCQVTTDLNGLNDLLASAKRLVFEGTSIAIQQDRTFGVQQRPSTEARQEALKEKQAPVGATNDEGRQQAELEQENSTVESKPKTELEMPLASDDAVVWTASNGYEFVGSNAMSQALRYARTQNAVMFGNRAGVSLQVPAYVMPLYPLSAVYLQAAGLTAAYKANGLSWSFNSDGILGAMDALYAGAVSGSGTFWMPVAPGITSLPSDPTVTTGTGAPANSTTTPSGFNPTAPGAVFASLPTGQAPSYAQSIAPTALVPYVNERVPLVAGTRTALSVTALDYALTLPTATAVLVTKAEIAVAARLAADATTFTASGQAAAFAYSRTLSAEAGSLAATGFGAGSIRDYRIGTNFGIFVGTGQNANLVYQRAPFAVDAGSVELNGQDAEFRKGIILAADAGALIVSGQDAGSLRSYSFPADAGSFAVTGQAASLGFPPNVALLLHMDGANGGNTFADSSGKNYTVTPSSGMTTSTTIVKFGSASAYASTTSHYLSMTGATAANIFGFGSANFTVEAWIYPTQSTTSASIYAWGITSSIVPSSFLEVNTTSGSLSFLYSTNGSSSTQLSGGAAGLLTNGWHHVAIAREGSTMRGFIDGVQVFSGAISGTIANQSARSGYIMTTNGGSNTFLGYLDEFRVIKGSAIYTGNFVPPTAAFPNP